ncbi:unnamed protein product, partial [Rotaria magnacalcarata]
MTDNNGFQKILDNYLNKIKLEMNKTVPFFFIYYKIFKIS